MLTAESAAVQRAGRIQILVKMTGLSNKEFSKKNDISLSTLNTWIYCLTDDFADKAAKRLIEAAEKSGVHVSMGWLMTGLGMYPQLRHTPYATSRAETPESAPYKESEIFRREIQFFCKHHPNAVTLMLADEGMTPVYLKGDCVGGQFLAEKDIDQALEKNCIIKTKKEEIVCRHLTAGTEKNRFNFYMINPYSAKNEPPIIQNADIISAAPIVRVWRLFY